MLVIVPGNFLNREDGKGDLGTRCRRIGSIRRTVRVVAWKYLQTLEKRGIVQTKKKHSNREYVKGEQCDEQETCSFDDLGRLWTQRQP